MIQIEFSDQEKQALYYERFHYPHPRVQKKMEALWLKSQEIPHHQISLLVAIAPNTLRTYLRDYQEGGIEKLKEINFYRPQSELEEHRISLEDYFRKNLPASRGGSVNSVNCKLSSGNRIKI